MAMLHWFVNLLLIPVVPIYLLRDWEPLLEQVRNVLPGRLEPTVARLAAKGD